MASRDYFGGSPPRREDAPLPPVPTTPADGRGYKTNNSVIVSEQTSPFADQSYPTYPNPSSQRFHQESDGDAVYADSYQYDTDHRPYDPFGDRNAIPLQSQTSKRESIDPASRFSPDHERQYYEENAERGSGHRHRRSRKKGWFKGPVPWVVYGLTIIQVAVFIGEIIKNSTLTGSPIAIHPSFNPMIGPSPYVLINMGARYVPCMRNTANITDRPAGSGELSFPCPNTTSSIAACTLSDLCGFNGVPNPHPGGTLDDQPQPNQWFRFIVPIFLHAGLVHIGFNMLLQVTLGKDIEREIGSLRFFVVYFASGIFGFVFGGNFAFPGIAPVGASGALFGIFAMNLLSLLYTWRERRSPIRDLLFIIADIVICFVLGLLPGFDNFSHIGGFLMGLCCGVCVLHSPNALRRRIGQGERPYDPVNGERSASDATRRDEIGPGYRLSREVMARGEGLKGFTKNPVGFFKDRPGLWWAWWLLRAGALVGVIVVFIVLLNNFYVYRTQCTWCKYLSCINVNGWCNIGQIDIQNQTSKAKRDVFGVAADAMAPVVLDIFA